MISIIYIIFLLIPLLLMISRKSAQNNIHENVIITIRESGGVCLNHNWVLVNCRNRRVLSRCNCCGLEKSRRLRPPSLA